MSNVSPREYPVGLLYFSEDFGSVLEKRLNECPPLKDRRGQEVKIVAEHVRVHEIPVDFATKYRVIIDRASHYLRQSLGILMTFAFDGVHIVNNPLSMHYFIANKDAGYAMIHRLGVPVPPTYVLPTHENPGFEEKDFRYHQPFDWETMMKTVGFPCYIKPAEGRGAFGVDRAESVEQLWQFYNKSGSRVMTVQAEVQSKHDWHVRCICVGRTIVPIQFTFGRLDTSRYVYDETFLDPETTRKVTEYARVINRTFGYEMNSVEFVIDTEGNPWAIDFNNPIPDGRLHVLGQIFFDAYIRGLVNLVRDKAYWDSPASFLPPLNRFADIARKDVPREQRFREALAVANGYYEPSEGPEPV